MAILFAVWGLFGPNYMLLFIALFVWSGAVQESRMVEMRAALAGIPVARAMATRFHVLQPDEPVVRAADVARAGLQRDFPVAQDGELVGVVMRDDLSRALASESPMVAVRDVMRRDFETIGPHDTLNVAISKLQECECRMLPVIDHDRLVGLLLADHVAEALMSQDAARDATDAQPAGARA
jgi:predicted transcriptional regulator